MITEMEARQFADHWVQAWNTHDLDAIMSHYGEDIMLVSPLAVKRLDVPSGTVRGTAALRDYFRRGLEAYPDLKFELIDVMWGVSSVVLYYANQQGARVGEFMAFDASKKVVQVVANYNV